MATKERFPGFKRDPKRKNKHAVEINGEEFLKAANRYSLPITNAGINEIVKLVNTADLTPLQAARKIHKEKR